MNNTCCFIGHRNILRTPELEKELYAVVERLITEEKVQYFLFGSKSQFNSLCWETVTDLKIKYPNISRIYVRSSFPDISDSYKDYLLQYYEDTYFPDRVMGAGKVSYIKRNYEMIEKSRFCVFYYKENNLPQERKSGTKIAYEYSLKKEKETILIEN